MISPPTGLSPQLMRLAQIKEELHLCTMYLTAHLRVHERAVFRGATWIFQAQCELGHARHSCVLLCYLPSANLLSALVTAYDHSYGPSSGKISPRERSQTRPERRINLETNFRHSGPSTSRAGKDIPRHFTTEDKDSYGTIPKAFAKNRI